MDDTDSFVMYFLIIFWAVMIAGSAYFSSDINYMVSGDISDLNNGGSTAIFTSLWYLMSFKVTSSVFIFVGIILDVLTVLSVITVYKMIFGR